MPRDRAPAVHHLALRTRDVDGLAEFYERWLGLPRLRDLRPRAIWLGLGGSVLMVERAGDGEPAPDPHSLDLFAVRVGARRREDLRDALLREGRLEAETEHTLYFRDPDGRRVGVSTFPFRAGHPRAGTAE